MFPQMCECNPLELEAKGVVRHSSHTCVRTHGAFPLPGTSTIKQPGNIQDSQETYTCTLEGCDMCRYLCVCRFLFTLHKEAVHMLTATGTLCMTREATPVYTVLHVQYYLMRPTHSRFLVLALATKLGKERDICTKMSAQLE